MNSFKPSAVAPLGETPRPHCSLNLFIETINPADVLTLTGHFVLWTHYVDVNGHALEDCKSKIPQALRSCFTWGDPKTALLSKFIYGDNPADVLQARYANANPKSKIQNPKLIDSPLTGGC